MITKKFTKKLKRYLDLSKEFEMSESSLFGGSDNDTNSVRGSVSSWMDSISVGRGGTGICEQIVKKPNKVKSRSMKILEEAAKEACRADRYDEYIKLRTELYDSIKGFKILL